ncbi:MAG: hypothetical protein K6F71_14650 [Ruminococcus sp.]|uniref:hypothetical protein n=1 Tax=Ruminococcus sp. TaxID=41978 RepID=UPI0025F2A377|nr:hypothetical protein [Ruminococcus sp.]MCR5542044.1 hypothetical protein [Ruminococcus sp.]
MTFEAIYNIALEVANARAQSGEYIAPDETICVICSRTGRVYNGVSHMGVHAEIEAMRNMQTYGNEVAIESMVLIATISRSPMLPCTGCINYIISMSPENSMGYVVMPDRMISLSEMLGTGTYAPNTPFSGMPNGMPAAAPVQSGYLSGQFVQSVQYSSAAPVPSTPLTSMTSSQMEGASSKSDLLKNRVSSLMSVAENDDEEDAEFLEELGIGKKKKGLFGLFG